MVPSGTAWLRQNKGVLLQVPSAIVPETANYLFNPRHTYAARYRTAGVFPIRSTRGSKYN